MGKIVCLMGKSASGKDTVYKYLLERGRIKFKKLLPYTTRPARDGEKNGVEYVFVTEEERLKLSEAGKVVESRAYETMDGIWHYFTVDDGKIKCSRDTYLLIGTLEAYEKLKDYFGVENVLPVCIRIEDGERLQRALDRERRQDPPKYEEMCRRFLSDAEDFSKDNMKKAGIIHDFENNDLIKCVEQIEDYVKEWLNRL